MTEFTFSFDDISALEFTGISSEYINDETTTITNKIWEGYGDVIEGAIPALAEFAGECSILLSIVFVICLHFLNGVL